MTKENKKVQPKEVISRQYRRKSSIHDPPSLKVDDTYSLTPTSKVTQENFVTKMLEVMKPVSSSNPNKLEDEEEDLDEFCIKKRVKNVHELIESGGVSRLLDELDYFACELVALKGNSSPSSIKYRHSLLVDLGAKLFKKDITPMQTSRIRSTGILERIIESIECDEGKDFEISFIILILHFYCSEIRRIDHFIDNTKTIEAILWLSRFNKFNAFSDLFVEHLKLGKIKIPQESFADLSLWLTAKLIMSVKTSGSDSLEVIKLFSKKNDLIPFFVDLTTIQDESQGQRLSRLLVIFEYLLESKQSFHHFGEQLFDLIANTYSSLCLDEYLSATFYLLISATGDPGRSIYLSQINRISTKSIEMTEYFLSKSLNAELTICALTLIINFADHDQEFSKALGARLDILKMLTNRLNNQDHSRLYSALLIALLYSRCPSILNYIESAIIQVHNCLIELLSLLKERDRLTKDLSDKIGSLLEFLCK